MSPESVLALLIGLACAGAVVATLREVARDGYRRRPVDSHRPDERSKA